MGTYGVVCRPKFVGPKTYEEDFIGRFVSTALLEFLSYGIGPHNFTKSEGDRLFTYGISFALFAGFAETMCLARAACA